MIRTAKQVMMVVAGVMLGLGCESPASPQLSEGSASTERSANAPVVQVSGGGSIAVATTFATIAFHASRNGDGEAKGSFNYESIGLETRVKGDVTCLVVAGNQAWITGVITSSTNETYVQVGQSMQWTVQDNGEGNGAPPDRLSAILFGNDPNDCVFALALVKDWTNGNVQIK